MNDGRVYAAYDYIGEHDDELSFLAGEELRVVKKDDVEKVRDFVNISKICQTVSTSNQGTIPVDVFRV